MRPIALRQSARSGGAAGAMALLRAEKARTHRKALDCAQVPAAIEAVAASGASPALKLCFERVALTAGRSGEARGALWAEVDRDRAAWVGPAERRKGSRPHRVPFPPRALAILDAAGAFRDASGLLFPSPRGKALSDMTLSKLVKEPGVDADVHGLRRSFRTWAQERTNLPRDVAELALAHRIGDATEAGHARSDLRGKRRKLREGWSAHLAARRGDVVMPAGRARA